MDADSASIVPAGTQRRPPSGQASVHQSVRHAVLALVSRHEWMIPLGIFVMSRILTTIYLVIGASRQTSVGESPAYHSFVATPASPSYWTATTNWDGQWYEEIAERGYPAHVVMDRPRQTPYAFYPLYPMLCRLVMSVTHLPFNVVAPFISTAAGGGAMLLLYRLFRRNNGMFVASAAIMVLCAFPTSPVLQVAYTESLALLLIVAALTFVADRRYGVFVAIIVVLALTRPVALPMSVVIAAHFWRRWRAGEVGAAGTVTWKRVIFVCGATGLSAGLWPALAGVLSGLPNVYLRTMHAWPVNNMRFGGQLNPASFGGAVSCLVWGFLITWFLVLRRRADTGWSTDLRVWSGTYVGYLALTVGFGPSLLRYAMLVLVPMWPFAEDPDPDEGRADRIARILMLGVVVIFGLITQYLWITRVFTIPVDPAQQLFP